VPFPPCVEQRRIVEELQPQLDYVDTVETSTSLNLRRASRLRQAILKRAFEGKLVPQDPNDEPASALLERIRAERAANGVSSRSGRNTVAHGVSRGKKRSIKAASPRGV